MIRLFIVLMFLTGPALAQAACLPHDQAIEQLKKAHGEQMIGVGLSKRGMAITLFTSESGTWTITFTRPNGQTCILDEGEAWETTVPPPLQKGAPT